MSTSKKFIGLAFGGAIIVSLMLLFRKKLAQQWIASTINMEEESEPSSKFLVEIVKLQERLNDISDLTYYRKIVPEQSFLKEYCQNFDAFLSQSFKDLDTLSNDHTLGLKWKIIFKRNNPKTDQAQTKYEKIISQGDNAIISEYLNFFKSVRESMDNLIKEAPNKQTREILLNILKGINIRTEDLLMVISKIMTEQKKVRQN